MNLKTYHADSIAKALSQIKRELGPNAVILHTRTYKKGGLFGIGARTRVEITAADGAHAPPRRRRRSPSSLALQAQRAYGASPRPSTQPRGVAVATLVEDAAALSPSDAAPSPAQPQTSAATDDSLAAETREAPTDADARILARSVVREANADAARGALEPDLVLRELATVKRLVAGVLRSNRQGLSGPAPADALVERYAQLLEQEVAAEIADEVIAVVREDLTRAELADEALVLQQIRKQLAAFIPTANDSFANEPPTDGRPRTIALVGPTGVGKTTTVAKLASIYKLKHGRRVGLVTSDTYRIAAVDQLRTYANIIGLPLKVALTPREMASSCASLASCDVILIDTAGRSPRDEDRLRELRDFVRAANPHETHLVLSGAASEQAMLEAAQRFAVASPDRLIFTKLDEMVQYGALVNAAARIGKQLSYITTGQEVPDHLEPGSGDRLASLVLGGACVR